MSAGGSNLVVSVDDMRMIRPRHALVASISLLVIMQSSVSPALAASSQTPVQQLSAPIVSDHLPDGWAVCGIRDSYNDRPNFARFTLYGQLDGHGALRGPAIAVGPVTNEFGFSVLPGDARIVNVGNGLNRRARPGDPGSTADLTRSGPLVWLVWANLNGDTNVLLAARGLSEKQAIAAARATKRTGRFSFAVRSGALPGGMRPITTARIEPSDDDPYGNLMILKSESEQASIAVDAHRATPAAQLLQHFWADQAHRRANAQHSVVTRQHNTVIYAEGAAPTNVLRDVARSMHTVDDATWRQFKSGNLVGVPVESSDECRV